MSARYHGDRVEVGRTTGQSVEAPAVAIICTIPYIDTSTTPLPPAYATSTHETGTTVVGKSVIWAVGGGAFTRLFESGDRVAPRQVYRNGEAFKGSLVCDAFRGAAWMTDVHVYHDGQRAIGASYHWGVRVGFTPVRPQLLHPDIPFDFFQWCLSGESRVGPNEAQPELIESLGGYIATLRFEFKLCPPANAAQWLFTHYLAPFAWMQIDYGLHWSPATQGQAFFVPTGSHLPRLHPYVDWQSDPYWVYDMRETAQDDVHDFVEAVPCQAAPARGADLQILKAF